MKPVVPEAYRSSATPRATPALITALPSDVSTAYIFFSLAIWLDGSVHWRHPCLRSSRNPAILTAGSLEGHDQVAQRTRWDQRLVVGGPDLGAHYGSIIADDGDAHEAEERRVWLMARPVRQFASATFH